MKIKQQPDDFYVEELTGVVPSSGPFALYRLEKRGWTTPDALQAVRRRWRLDFRRLSYGGLKDRHAHTIQFFSVLRGPQRNLTHQGFTVAYLGQIDHPYSAADIEANRFRLVVRDLSAQQTDGVARQLGDVQTTGFPNYFDDQRFGSVAAGQQFPAKEMVRGRYEEALRLILTAPYEHDRRPQKKEKATLVTHWGNWAECKQRLPRGHARSLVDYLVSHPTDFRGALDRLRPEMRSLYLSAYQSYLWNRMLAAWLEAQLPAERLLRVELRLGPAPMYTALPESTLALLRELRLPLHHPRAILEETDPRRPFFERVLREEELTLDQFKLKGLKNAFFSRGDRAALCLPLNLQAHCQPDERHPGRSRCDLHFDLPRGSYATLLIKRLIQAHNDEDGNVENADGE